MPQTRSRFGNPLYQRHVKVDAKEVLEHLDSMADLIRGGDPRIPVFGMNELKKETRKAFSSRINPGTGRSWPPRRHSYPWPLLHHTGTLQGFITHGFGIKTRDRKIKLFGKVRAGSYLGGYSRGGGGAFYGAHKPIELVAGAVMYGRKKARSAAGYKKQVHGYIRNRGRMTFHGGGTKLFDSSSTGTVPPRPFFGMGQMAKFRTKRYAQRIIKQVFN